MTLTPGSWLRGARLRDALLRGARLAAVATLAVLATGCWTKESTPSATVTVASYFRVTAPATTTAGTPFTVTVTAKNAAGVTITSYLGTVHFTSSDPGGPVLPANYTFVAGDNGTHTFTNGVTLKTTPSQTVTVNDTIDPTKTGFATIPVTAGIATKVGFTQQPNGGAAGVAWTTQPVVAIQDAQGNTVTTSSASVTLSRTSGPSAVLTCTGGNSKAAVSGIVTFAGCNINLAGTGYILTATAAGLTTAASNAFNIT